MATRPQRRAPAAGDGRVRRGERSGRAIVKAMLRLVGGGTLEPTAQQVASEAGVGIRTVFRRFTDMERLFAEMDADLQAAVVPLLVEGRPEGGRATRARTLVGRRAAFFERIGPYKRAANVKRWRSPFLRDRHALLVRALRTELLRWLPELGRAPHDLVAAVELATSFEAWDRLRTEQRLGSARARAAVERTVLALVARSALDTKGSRT